MEAATLEWQNEQAALAAELGISYEDWQRIARLLSKPPPKLVGGHLVMNSVAIGRAMVVDQAVECAVRAPLQQSVESAIERREAEGTAEGKKHTREVGIEQTPFGKNVTEALPLIKAKKARVEAKAEASRMAKEKRTSERASKQQDEVMKASHALVVKEKGSAKGLSIGNLLRLIKWAGGQVTTDLFPHPIPTLSTNLIFKPHIHQHAGDYVALTHALLSVAGTPIHQEGG